MKALHRSIAGMALPALLLVAGCDKPLAQAGYAAPTDGEAVEAYRQTILGKHIEGSSSEVVAGRLEKAGGMDGTNYYALSMAQQRESHNEQVEKVARNLEAAKVSDCVWERFKPGVVKAKYDEKVSGPAPEAAYRCKVAVTLDTDKRGLVDGPTEGFFFKKDDAFVFVGKLASDFKRQDGVDDTAT
jgi:hypothetical protein